MGLLTFQNLCAADFDKFTRTDSGQLVRKAVVVLNGRTALGRSILLLCEGFTPSLKVRSDDNRARSILSALPACAEQADKDGECRALPEVVSMRDLRGYSERPTVFTQWTFTSAMDFLTARKRLREEGVVVYDAALPACMQMLCALSLTPCQWMDVEAKCSYSNQYLDYYVIHWTRLNATVEPPCVSAPFKVMAFDIECYSSHGEFPQALKAYQVRSALNVVIRQCAS